MLHKNGECNTGCKNWTFLTRWQEKWICYLHENNNWRHYQLFYIVYERVYAQRFVKHAVQKIVKLFKVLSSTFPLRLFEPIMFALLRSYFTISFHSKSPLWLAPWWSYDFITIMESKGYKPCCYWWRYSRINKSKTRTYDMWKNTQK